MVMSVSELDIKHPVNGRVYIAGEWHGVSAPEYYPIAERLVDEADIIMLEGYDYNNFPSWILNFVYRSMERFQCLRNRLLYQLSTGEKVYESIREIAKKSKKKIYYLEELRNVDKRKAVLECLLELSVGYHLSTFGYLLLLSYFRRNNLNPWEEIYRLASESADECSKTDFGRKLLDERNMEMAKKIREVLEKEGDGKCALVVVGITHTFGKNSLPECLKKVGVKFCIKSDRLFLPRSTRKRE